MLLLKIINGWINKLLNAGLHPQLSYGEIKRTRFANALSLMSFSSSFFFVFIYSKQGCYPLNYITGLYAILFLLAYLLSTREYFSIAFLLLYSTILLDIFSIAYYIGDTVDVEVFYIPISIIPFLLFGSEKRNLLYVSIVLISITMLAIFLTKDIDSYSINHQYYFINLAYRIVAFGGTLAFVFIFLNIIESIEKDIVREKNDLEGRNNQLYLSKQEQERINTIKDNLISLISHDIRSPLTNAALISELMINEQLSREEIAMIAEKFKQSATQTTHILDNLLNWSYADLKEYDPVEINIKEVIEKSISSVLFMARDKHISVCIEAKDDLIALYNDGILEIVIRNLFTNAVKFSKKGSEIIIRAQYENDKAIKIQVKDKGIGIPLHMIDRLFELDITKSRQGTENEKGAGVGLVMCKKILETNKGKISAENNEHGGATFNIYIC